MLAHDALVIRLPLLLHFLELDLADHRVNARAEMARDALGLADDLTQLVERARQVLRADHDDRHDDDHQQFGRSDV